MNLFNEVIVVPNIDNIDEKINDSTERGCVNNRSILLTTDMSLKGHIGIRPLTLSNLLYTSIRNEGKSLYFCLIRLLYKYGFINIGECESFNWRHLTLKCFSTLRKRQRIADNFEFTKGLRKYAG